MLVDEYDLADESIAEFRRDGCALVRGLCNAEEIEAIRAVIADAVAERSRNVAPLSERDVYGKAFLQIENLWLLSMRPGCSRSLLALVA